MLSIVVEWGSEEVLGVGDALLWPSRAGSPPMSAAHRPHPPKWGRQSQWKLSRNLASLSRIWSYLPLDEALHLGAADSQPYLPLLPQHWDRPREEQKGFVIPSMLGRKSAKVRGKQEVTCTACHASPPWHPPSWIQLTWRPCLASWQKHLYPPMRAPVGQTQTAWSCSPLDSIAQHTDFANCPALPARTDAIAPCDHTQGSDASSPFLISPSHSSCNLLSPTL